MGSLVVSNVSKAYKRYPSKWARAREWLFGTSCHESTWILRDINFRVEPGEAVGIVGVNGAGKSTLLKIITGTTQPTSGHVLTNGRVAALLELGMGFHPDFTGRQNALMAGQLIGLSLEEISELMSSIERFANIGEYFDRPLRVYSSGMQARVAFSVATAVRPDILIVDEVLSVGDIAFQAKCMQRMNTLIDSGVTVLFVSHALSQVRQFCSKAIYLSEGRIKAIGAADNVCDLYQNDLVPQQPSISHQSFVAPPDLTSTLIFEKDNLLRANSVDGLPGTLDLEFLSFQVLDENEQAISSCSPNDKIILKASIIANTEVSDGAAVGLLISDKTGYPLLSCNSNYYNVRLPKLTAGNVVVMTWNIQWPFYSGEFRVDIGIKPDPFSDNFYDRVFCAKTMAVNTPAHLLKENFGGYLHVKAVVTASIVNGI